MAAKYYCISSNQIFMSSVCIGIISAALITINNNVNEYFQLPVVIMSSDKCVSVKSFKNGEAFTCSDVDVTLRNYRLKRD